MSRPNFGKRPKPSLGVSGIKRLFKFWVLLRNLSNCDIAIRGKGGKETHESKPLYSTITIPPHCLNTTDVNNYSVRANGKWSCGCTILKESDPLRPLGGFGKSHNRPIPRVVEENAPMTFYRSLLALVMATLRFGKMSWVEAQGRYNLYAVEFLESELAKKKVCRRPI